MADFLGRYLVNKSPAKKKLFNGIGCPGFDWCLKTPLRPPNFLQFHQILLPKSQLRVEPKKNICLFLCAKCGSLEPFDFELFYFKNKSSS